MANTPIEKRLLGGLDTDTNVQLVRDIDYIDAFNLQNVNKDGFNEDLDIAPLVGNEFAFELKNAYTDNRGKIYTLLVPIFNYTDLPSVKFLEMFVYTQNGILVATIDAAYPAISSDTDLATLIETEILSQANLAANVTISTPIASTGYQRRIDIEVLFPNNTSENYIIAINNLVPSVVEYELFIKRECYPILGGVMPKMQIIGRFNVLDDLFMWATPIKNRTFPSRNINTVNTSVNLTYNTFITVFTGHGLVDGEQVVINDAQQNPHINGIWTVQVLTPFDFALINSNYSTFVSTTGNIGTWKKYVSPFGAIYHAKRNVDTWGINDAIPLLFSRDMNFITTSQIDCLVKSNNIQWKFKWTDNLNPYRLLIYKGQFKTLGFIFDPIDNPDGIYTFEGINEASKLNIGDTPLKVSVQEVVGAGSLTTKNYVYYAALVNDGNTRTAWSYPSNPISIISTDVNDNSEANTLAFNGNVSAEPTNKAVEITVSNIPQGAFKFLEIGVVEYRLGVFTGYTLSRIPLSRFDTEATTLHTSATENTLPLDTIELNRLYAAITRGLNIVEMDNRTVESNVWLQQDPDLSDMVSSIQYSVKRHNLTKSGLLTDPVPLTFGEHRIPNDIVNFTGYSLFDTVRLGIVFKLKNKGKTLAYHIDDVVIDASGASGQRLAGLPDYSLADSNNAFTFYIEVQNINWDYVIPNTGERLRDIVEDAYFVRSRVNSEVVASGYIVMGEYTAFPLPVYEQAFDNTTYTPSVPADERKICFFYSPDTNVSNLLLQPRFGDRLYVLGQATRESQTTVGTDVAVEWGGNFGNTYGDFAIETAMNFFDNTILPTTATFFATNLQWGTKTIALEVDAQILPITSNTDYGVYAAYYIRPKQDLYPTNIELSSYIPINGVQFDIANDTPATTYDVFGGDTFTRKNFLLAKRTSDEYIFGFYSQGKNNTNLTNLIFPGYFSGNLTTKLTAYFASPDDYFFSRYDNSFNILNNINSIGAFDPRETQQGRAAATIYWSEQAFEDSAQTNDQYFLPLNNRALDLTAGEIVHMIVANDILYTLQPNRTERQYFDNTNQLQAVDGSTILLGTGQVMGTKGEFKSTYGCSNKWSVVPMKTDGGRENFLYVDALRRKIVRNGDDGTVVISDRTNIAQWCLKNMTLLTQQLTPADNFGVHGVWDDKNKQAILTSRTYRNVNSEWDVGVNYPIGWTVTNNQFYNFDGMPVVYVAIAAEASTSDNEPGVGRDWGDVWERANPNDSRYYNWWSLVWSEKEDRFKWWISPKPKIWLPYMETILSPNPSPYSQSNEYGVWEHTERGLTCQWYAYNVNFDSVSPTQLNPTQIQFAVSIYTVLPNISLWGEDFCVEIQAGINGEFIRIIGLNNTGTIATLESPNGVLNRNWVLRISQKKEPYIEGVINENKGVRSKFVVVQYSSELAPTRTEMQTNEHRSFLAESDFTDEDEYYSSSIKFDTTNNPTNNQADTSMIFGKWMKIKTFLGFDRLQRLNNFVVKIRPLNRLISK
jgi:hypothetical protein